MSPNVQIRQFFSSLAPIYVSIDVRFRPDSVTNLEATTTKTRMVPKPRHLLRSAPHFVRFATIEIEYFGTEHENWRAGERWAFAESTPQQLLHLQQLRSKITASKLIFHGNVNRNEPNNHSNFPNFRTLLDHIENDLLAKFGDWQEYEFKSFVYSDKDAATDYIATLLEFEPIFRSSNVAIHLYVPLSLPVKAISNWLNRTSKWNGPKEIFLRIKSDRIQNEQEMIDELKKVFNLFLIFE